MASPRLNLGQGALPEPARDTALRERERFQQHSVGATNKPEWMTLGYDMDSWLELQWQQCCDEERPAGELQEKLLQQAKDVFDRVFPPIAGHETMTMPAERFYPRYLELEALAAAPSKAATSPENTFWHLAAVCWLTLSHTLRIGMSPALLRSLLPMTRVSTASETLGYLTRSRPERAPPAAAKVVELGVASLQHARDRAKSAGHAASAGGQALLGAGRRFSDKVSRVSAAIAENRTGQVRHLRDRPEVPDRPAIDVQTAQGPGRAIHGRALRKSIIPTWLGLVGLSWVSLIWGALISVPFGVGLGIFASLLAGLVAVPLWGTIFGFVGMNAARSSTLGKMGFRTLPDDHPVTAKIREFAERLDLPMPRVGSVPVYNAFAMGSHETSATVAMGEPLIETLDENEWAAIVGHELGHIVSGDMRRMMLMRTFQNACVWFMFAQGLKQFARWVISWVAELFILGFSRRREYWADAIGAELAGKEAMIGALRKLETAPALTGEEKRNARFMFRGKVNALFSTHPQTSDRIAALEAETYLRRLPRRGA